MPDEKIKARKADKNKVATRVKNLVLPPGYDFTQGMTEREIADQAHVTPEQLQAYRDRVQKEAEQYPGFAMGYGSVEPSIDPGLTAQTQAISDYNYRQRPPVTPREKAAVAAANQDMQRKLKYSDEPEVVQARMAIPEVITMPDPNAPQLQWKDESGGEYEDLGDGFWKDLRTDQIIRVTPAPVVPLEEQLKMIQKGRKLKA